MKSINLAYIVIALIIGIGIGYGLSPEYRKDMYQKESGMVELGNPDKWIDERFIDGMIAHHLTAIDLAKQAEKYTARTEIQDLSKTIIAADTASIADLYQWKQQWYGNTRQVTRFTKINLGTADENFDLRLLNALISHHQEAIDVTGEVQTKSTRNEILTLASKVKLALTQGKTALESLRKSWYNL